MSESNVLISADKVLSALITVLLSEEELKPPSFPELSAVNPDKEPVLADTSLIAEVSVFAVVVKLVCGLEPMSESNSLIAPTKSESIAVSYTHLTLPTKRIV